MVRPRSFKVRFFKVYLWIILWVVVALLLMMLEAVLFPQPTFEIASQIRPLGGNDVPYQIGNSLVGWLLWLPHVLPGFR